MLQQELVHAAIRDYRKGDFESAVAKLFQLEASFLDKGIEFNQPILRQFFEKNSIQEADIEQLPPVLRAFAYLAPIAEARNLDKASQIMNELIRGRGHRPSKDECFLYGLMIMRNWGIKQHKSNLDSAKVWLRSAANKGHARAKNLYGAVLSITDPGSASWIFYLEAQELGVARAKSNLGMLYYHGDSNNEPEYERALRWFKGAGEEVIAQLYLGKMHEKGLGVPRDLTKAITYYSQSAEQGNPDALKKLNKLKAKIPQSNKRKQTGEANSSVPRPETTANKRQKRKTEQAEPAKTRSDFFSILRIRVEKPRSKPVPIAYKQKLILLCKKLEAKPVFLKLSSKDCDTLSEYCDITKLDIINFWQKHGIDTTLLREIYNALQQQKSLALRYEGTYPGLQRTQQQIQHGSSRGRIFPVHDAFKDYNKATGTEVTNISFDDFLSGRQQAVGLHKR